MEEGGKNRERELILFREANERERRVNEINNLISAYTSFSIDGAQ